MNKNQENTIFLAKNGQKVILREAVPKDADSIIMAVEHIIRTGTYIQKEKPRSLEEEKRFIEEMNDKNNMYIVVELEKEIVGIARVIRGELDMKRHTGLFRTWLIDQVQGQGIGSEIMTYTLAWCRLNSLHKLCLTVFASNGLAQKLYERYGFIIEGIQKEQVKIGNRYDDEIFMAYFFDI
ncbi:GNAT family N-acetyltransferase [Metabacillus litoralis]|uniref:GNAT family N-acetyltransferase n=1 Tax=Metabacillus litoralis TaxID=152268 RepID=UPI001CFF19AA|nr:GNAT family protein [Metabacillus litoralis]